MFGTVAMAECSTADYTQVVAGAMVNVEDIMVALTSDDVALVGASYTEAETADANQKSMVYLFDLNTCTYAWYMQGDAEFMLETLAVAWNVDETKGYVVS